MSGYASCSKPAAGKPLGVRERAAASAAANASDTEAWAAAESDDGEAGRLLSAAHVAFFERYGYVVVEGALPRALALRVASDVQEYMRSRHSLDVGAPPGALTLPKLQRAFSPDGSGMIELYWLASMEEARARASARRGRT